MTGPAGNTGGVDGLLARARDARARGDLLQAAQLCQQALEQAPDDVATLKLAGESALADGQFAQAKQMFERVVEQGSADVQLFKNLGLASIGAKRPDEARHAFDRALTLEPDYYVARLYLGHVLESLGHGDAALREYYSAILQAQRQDRWLGPDTTPTHLQDMVTAAMRFVDAGRRRMLEEPLVRLRAQHGADALRRADRAFAVFLGAAEEAPADPLQKPRFMYFPGLPATRWFDRALFDWYELLESNAAVVREELLGVLHAAPHAGPLFKMPGATPGSAGVPSAGAPEQPAWQTFHFYRRGVRNEENCALCPRTAALVDTLPLVHIRAHAPEIRFSALAPGASVAPSHGATNIRLVTQLPLVVPTDCAIIVGGEERALQEGRCVTFDDSFLHETWNRGDQTRYVLALDTWNPHLTSVEREAVAQFIEAIGTFERECGIVA